MSKRYKAIEGSQSAHCCFEATVLDTLEPELDGDFEIMIIDGKTQYPAVCECFDMGEAVQIANALNRSVAAGI